MRPVQVNGSVSFQLKTCCYFHNANIDFQFQLRSTEVQGFPQLLLVHSSLVVAPEVVVDKIGTASDPSSYSDSDCLREPVDCRIEDQTISSHVPWNNVVKRRTHSATTFDVVSDDCRMQRLKRKSPARKRFANVARKQASIPHLVTRSYIAQPLQATMLCIDSLPAPPLVEPACIRVNSLNPDVSESSYLNSGI